MWRRGWQLIGVLVLILALLAPAAGIAQEESDDRVRISFAVPIIDSNGELWLKLGFYQPLGDKPPTDLFSYFFSVTTAVDGENSTVTYEIHDGVVTPLGEGAASVNLRIFILESGCVLIATGLHPSEPFTASVSARWGSWVEGESAAVFSSEDLSDHLSDVEHGDPFDILGPAVFDLATDEMIMPGRQH